MIRIIKLIFKVIYYSPSWLIVIILGPYFYEKKYLKGKYFQGVFNEGWLWASRDIHNRILTKKHWKIPWPASPSMECTRNIIFHPDDINNFQGQGSYFQTFDSYITIGKGTMIARNVGLITSNHDPQNLQHHIKGKDITIGNKCWIGMNSVILPGVILGDDTIVGAGAVVTKSFPEGHVIIAGNPAQIIKDNIGTTDKESIQCNL